jgi:hypothetical protein
MTSATGSDCGFLLPGVKYFSSCSAARSGSRCTKPLVYFLAVNGHIPGSGEAVAYLAVSYPEHGDTQHESEAHDQVGHQAQYDRDGLQHSQIMP